MITIRPARTADVREIRTLIDSYSADGSLLSKATVTIFEGIQEFLVATDGERVIASQLKGVTQGMQVRIDSDSAPEAQR